ncbi:SDR family NAD(P)-dependent oxidoreductase [Amycolatopsis thermoflava]|uniref:SDR family NAD(P)-dependent oxidoreductase n=1 Tax=Amycolatopsis thermoflava TaxID=84480 RepID=UPI000415D7BE|nr:glucose 1-dehydrogenase [Amycolatopsis thermoflava]
MRLRDKTALITGASSGMGRATATTFAREGATVVVADINDDDGAAVVKEIEADGGRARYLHLDVTDEDSWTTGIDEIVAEFGRLDVLVNNAGISGTFDPDLTSTAFFDQLMLVNAKGVFLGIKHGAAAMARSGGGSIVNLSSISASIGQLGVHLGYGASKAAVKSMTRTAAVHYADDGIRANAVAPGMLPPMRTSRGSADPVWRARQLDGVPMKRAGEVREVADVVLFLASDEASYVTGVEVLVDGGLTAV